MTFAGPNFNGCHDKYRYAVQTPLWAVCAVCKTDVRCVCVQCLNSFAVPIACHRPQRVHIEQADRLLCSPVAQVPSSFSIQGELARPHLPLATPSRAHILTACVPLLAVTNLLHAWSSSAGRAACSCVQPLARRPENSRASAMRASGMRVSGMCASGMRASGMLTIGMRRVRLGCVRCVRVGYVWSGGMRAMRASGMRASHMCTVVVACECLEYAHR